MVVVAGIFLAVTAVLVDGILTLRNQRVLSEVRLGQVRKGMTVADVESVFGQKGEAFPWAGVGTLAWRADDGGLIAATFSDAGRVQ